MDDNAKAKHEVMTKILSWGMIVYFLVFGYSLNQHALFELNPTPEQQKVVEAKKLRAEILRKKSASEKDEDKSSELRVKAAETDLEAGNLEDEMRDGIGRAKGLIIAATIFFVGYVGLVYFFYEKFKSAMTDYFVSRKLAIIYAVFIGLSIWITAFMTAYF